MKTITVRSGKGAKDRITTFPSSIKPFLRDHLSKVKRIHENDLTRKYSNAAKEWGWQYVFPSSTLSTDPRSGVTRRHHIDPSVVNKAIKTAVRKAGFTYSKPPGCFHNSIVACLKQQNPTSLFQKWGSDIHSMASPV